MGHYNKGKSFGGSRGGQGGNRFDSRGGYGGRDSGRPEMHKATCDECGNHCEVPFRPSGDKPIYCSDCFKSKGGGDSTRNSRDRGHRNFDRRDDRPRFDDRKPHYQDDHKKTENYKQQFEQLNSKLDRILKLITPPDTEPINESQTQKTRKAKKAVKKQVDTEAVQDVLSEALTKKSTVKKKLSKTTAKKSAKKTSPKIASGKQATKKKKTVKKK